MSNSSVVKNELKVYVRMHDGSRLLGSFFLSERDRLQDVMNDDRSFLPLHAVTDSGAHQMVMLSKRYIQQVEEVTHKTAGAADRRLQDQGRPDNGEERRSGQDRRQSAMLQFELDDAQDMPKRRKSDKPGFSIE